MKVEERREQFVKAAIEVMAREGLDRATTRRIAEHAGTAQAAIHYAFRGKDELLTAVIGTVTEQVEQILRDAVTPEKGLAAAIGDAARAFWAFVVGDDGLQLMQYELMIYCRRNSGFEWLAAWQYTRYCACVEDVFRSALAHETSPPPMDLAALTRFLVAAIDGLIIQYEVHHEDEQSRRDIENVITCALSLAGLAPALPSLEPESPA
ncbi:TetR/AcrR family transcriptional regulator [Streptomyces sp. CA-142005]|uniref:TetR/AcrR family transcriptional regulator n=1 Tax=Streptomyces sp. CA-142005 TaxID=3240052 RepID=UPI003D8DBCC5